MCSSDLLLPAAGIVRVGGIASTAATQDEVRAAGALDIWKLLLRRELPAAKPETNQDSHA